MLTHLVGDVITPMGIRPLYPFVPTSYTLDLVAARNPTANLALLSVGCLAFVAALAVERPRWVPPLRAWLAGRSDRWAPMLAGALGADEPATE